MSGSPSPLVTVIIPTHSHATTVDLAIQSVLMQTVSDLEVVVIGDGATPETRAVVDTLLPTDPRLRFLDRPKSPSRNENTRHELLTAARSTFVCYLGDDDLLLSDHVETMIGLLGEADFAHPAPVMIERDGTLRARPIDLARPECRQWHVRPGHNAVSLSGVAHRLDAYRRLPFGWRTPPPDRYSDHYMWEQWFRTPGLRFNTGTRLTMLKLDSAVRNDMSPAERRTEMIEWKKRSREPTFADEMAGLVSHAFRRWAVQATLDLARRDTRIWRLRNRILSLPVVVALRRRINRKTAKAT